MGAGKGMQGCRAIGLDQTKFRSTEVRRIQPTANEVAQLRCGRMPQNVCNVCVCVCVLQHEALCQNIYVSTCT